MPKVQELIKKKRRAPAFAREWIRIALKLDWMTRHRRFQRVSNERVRKIICETLAPDQWLFGQAGVRESLAKVVGVTVFLEDSNRQVTLESYRGQPTTQEPEQLPRQTESNVALA